MVLLTSKLEKLQFRLLGIFRVISTPVAVPSPLKTSSHILPHTWPRTRFPVSFGPICASIRRGIPTPGSRASRMYVHIKSWREGSWENGVVVAWSRGNIPHLLSYVLRVIPRKRTLKHAHAVAHAIKRIIGEWNSYWISIMCRG